MDIEALRQGGGGKSPHPGPAYFRNAADLALAIAERLGRCPQPPARILDLGCGLGDVVTALVARGYDAYGVDVGEWWGRDHDIYWHAAAPPDPAIRARLSVADQTDYRLVYPDAYFDLAMSAQVLEHVSNHVEVFRELGRVLKPGAISVNVFPGLGSLVEPHLGIPVTALAKHDHWLALWSLVSRHHDHTWRAEYHYLRENMRFNHYPSRRRLRGFARAAGVAIEFREREYLECSNSRPTRWLAITRRAHLHRLVSPILERLCQRTMILTKGGT